MEEDLIIGARSTKVVKKENLNLDRHYSLENFEKYILNFNKKDAEKFVKNCKIDTS